jgi:DNA-binding NarL/FixJ family response regulator
MTPLSPQQRQAVELAALGLGDKEIARRMAIGARSVKSHLVCAYRKLGVRNRVQAARMVWEAQHREMTC